MVTDVPFEPGSSPLVRGALPCPDLRRQAGGIIPARAGSTYQAHRFRCLTWDHPRSCGEHIEYQALQTGVTGSSPLVRGAPRPRHRSRSRTRIIPARAGSTVYGCELCVVDWDHPRSCGEHYALPWHRPDPRGSSPLVRGALFRDFRGKSLERIIPARAGSTM